MKDVMVAHEDIQINLHSVCVCVCNGIMVDMLESQVLGCNPIRQMDRHEQENLERVSTIEVFGGKCTNLFGIFPAI